MAEYLHATTRQKCLPQPNYDIGRSINEKEKSRIQRRNGILPEIYFKIIWYEKNSKIDTAISLCPALYVLISTKNEITEMTM